MRNRKTVNEAHRDRCLEKWGTSCGINLDLLDVGQRWVVFAALTFLTFVGQAVPLRRLVAYWLSHCGLNLDAKLIGAVVGTSDRAVRKARRLRPRALVQRLQRPRRGHRPAKLNHEQVGPVAKYLAEHRQ